MRKAKQKQEEKQVIEIKEDVKINENTILEPGDKIEVLNEFNYYDSELNRLSASPYGYNIQIKDGVGNSTKWMKLIYELLEKMENLIV